MKFSYGWLKELNNKIPAPEKAADLLTFHSFQVEGLKKSTKDTVLDIDILANRAADAMSHIGVTRELVALTNQKFSLPPTRLKESSELAKNLVSVRIEAKKLVPRYSARVISNIRVGESPAYIKERLIACGLRPVNNIVDVTNYVMLETGQPLHAFDWAKLSGKNDKKEIIVRNAKKGEMLRTLGDDGKDIKLESVDVVIADPRGAIALAGIKGGAGSEIDQSTTRVVLEAANFDATTVRKTSRRLGLRTDASNRFEHNLDPELISYALDRAAFLMMQTSGGVVAKGIVEVYTTKEPGRSIPFSVERASQLMGMEISEPRASAILQSLGCQIKRQGKGLFAVMPPSFRRDLNIEEDLIEEVVRVEGLEKVKPVMPPIFEAIESKTNRLRFINLLKHRLVGFGFTETQLSAFTGERALAPFGIGSSSTYQLENPTSPEAALLIPLAVIQYAYAAALNTRQFNTVEIFGIGRSFIKTKVGPLELSSLIIVRASREDAADQFYRLKGVADALLESFGITDHWYDDREDVRTRQSWAHSGRVAEIKIGDDMIGSIGELSRSLQEELKSKSIITIVEFNIDRLLSFVEAEREFRAIPKFPAVVRDVSVVLPDTVKVESVENIIADAAGELLFDTELFDYFRDEALQRTDKKSLAFHLVFQSAEKTLTDAEVDLALKKIAVAMIKKDWEIRS